jgi:DNA-binding PadR family transcriptional regulator
LAGHFTEEELAEQFAIRGYQLTDKGNQALKDYQAIIDRHPKKI